MFQRKLSIIVAGAFLFASVPAMAQGTTTTIPAKPTGKSDTKSDGAMKKKVMSPGMATEGRSGSERDSHGMTNGDTAH